MMYWGVVARRAWRETRSEIRLDSPVRVVIYIGVPVVAFTVVWITTQKPAWSVVGALFVLLVGSVCFLWKLFSIPPRMAAEAAERLDAISPPTTAAMPDWSLRELFFHLDPNVLVDDGTKPERWQVVGREVMDALSLGKLHSWGREIVAKSRRTPMVEISNGFWQFAHWTYFFFDPTDTQTVQAESHEDPPIYFRQFADIQVNRAQALKLWPKPLATISR